MGKYETLTRLLLIANRHTGIKELLDDFVVELQRTSGCKCIGIRLLDSNGNIPYHSYVGFADDFFNLESPLHIARDKCMCIYVIKGTVPKGASYITSGGSFWSNCTTKLLATASEEEKGQTRNECNRRGYESVALIPIKSGTSIMGLIQFADPRQNMLPKKLMESLEFAGTVLGDAIRRIRMESEVVAELKARGMSAPPIENVILGIAKERSARYASVEKAAGGT